MFVRHPTWRIVPWLIVALAMASADGADLTPDVSGTYGNQPGEEFLYFLPPAHQPIRAVVAFHPGIGGAPDQITKVDHVKFIANNMLENGLTIYSFSTPAVTPNQSYPVQVDSAAKAIQHLRANAFGFGFQPDRLIYWGLSFGSYVLGVLDEPWASYAHFHVEQIGCLMCRANLDDLSRESERVGDEVGERMFQSSVGFLSRHTG